MLFLHSGVQDVGASAVGDVAFGAGQERPDFWCVCVCGVCVCVVGVCVDGVRHVR